MDVGTMQEGNQFIINKIKEGKPFHIARLGGPCSIGTLYFIHFNTFKNLTALSNNDGIYTTKDKQVKDYYIKYNDSIKFCDALACFPSLCVNEQEYFTKKYELNKIHNRVVEPHHLLYADIVPWSHHLLGKRILIISPFVESFMIQLKNNFEIFSGKRVFLDGQDFVFYKGYNTSAGNHLHSSWIETFNIMKKDIQKLEFDIALVSCGGYGLLLCDFIKRELSKGAIYVGGGLQLQFGVIGNRWINNSMFQQGQKWIRPSREELPPHPERVENNCYG